MSKEQEVLDVLLQIRTDQQEMRKAQSDIKKLQKDMNGFGKLLNKTFDPKRLLAWGVGLVTIKKSFDLLKRSIPDGVNFTAGIEQAEVAFEVLLGGADKARERVESLVEFAAKTPFQLPGIVEANRQLQALTGGTLATEEGMKLVGDAAAATGRDMSSVAFWVGRTYAGLQTGTPVGEATLRLIEMGLISGEVALELQALAKHGRTAEDAFKIIEDTFSKTAGTMKKQSETFVGLRSTMIDTYKQIAGETTKPIFEGLKTGMREVLELLDALPTSFEKGVNKIIEIREKLSKNADNTVDATKTISDYDAEIVSSSKRLKELEDFFIERERLKEEYRDRRGIVRLPEKLKIPEDEIEEKRGEIDALNFFKNLPESSGIEDKIKELEELSKSLVKVKNPRNQKVTEEVRGLDEEETAQLEVLKKYRFEALKDKEKENKLKAEAAILEQKGLAITKKIAGTADKINTDHEKAVKAQELELASNERKKEILNERLALIDKVQAEEFAALEGNKKAELTKAAIIKRNETERIALRKDLRELDKKMAADAVKASEASFDAAEASVLLSLEQVKSDKERLKIGTLLKSERAEYEKLNDMEAVATIGLITLKRERLKGEKDINKQLSIKKEIADLINKLEQQPARDAADKLKWLKEENKQAEKRIEHAIDANNHAKEQLAIDGISITERGDHQKLLEQERNLVQEIIDLRKEELALVPAEQREAIQQEIDTQVQRKENVGSGTEIKSRKQESDERFAASGASAGYLDRTGDPDVDFQNMGDAAIAALQDYQSQLGSVRDDFYDTVMDMQTSLEGGLSGSIEGLVKGTMTLNDAFANVGQTVISSVVSSFAEMAAKYIVSKISMKAIDTKLKAVDTAENAAKGAADLASFLPAALAASIGSWGAAAAIGVGALLAAKAIIPGFEKGGLITGSEQLIKVNEKGKEYVIDNQTLMRYGVGFFDGLRSGEIQPTSPSPVSGATPSQNIGEAPKVFVSVHGDKDGAMEWLNGQEGQRVIIDTFRQNSDTLVTS